MGETTSAINADSEPQSPDEIRDSIDQTRDEMAQTVDAIQEKLSPAHITQQVKEATVNKAREVVVSASEKLKEVTSHASATTAQSTPAPAAESDPKAAVITKVKQLVNWVKAHPVPAGLATLAIVLFILRQVRGGGEYEYVLED